MATHVDLCAVYHRAYPSGFSATHLANALRPKLKYAAIIGSCGWSTKAVEQISGLRPILNIEVLFTVLFKGLPRADTFAAVIETKPAAL